MLGGMSGGRRCRRSARTRARSLLRALLLLPPNRLSLPPSHSSWIPSSAQDANALSSTRATYTSGPNDSSLTKVGGRPRRALALDALALRPGRLLELELNNMRSQLERDNHRLVELGQRRLPLCVSACLLSHSLRGLTRLSFALLCASWLWSWLRRVFRLSRTSSPFLPPFPPRHRSSVRDPVPAVQP